MKFSEKWNSVAVHIWLITSSFGIIYAFSSFIEDLKILSNVSNNYSWIKGLISIFLGILFYFIIGLPHLDGAKKRN